MDINEQGAIVGYSETKAKDVWHEPSSRAFLWQNGKMRDLGGSTNEAYAINNRGQIVGRSPAGRPFLWQKGRMRALGAGTAKWFSTLDASVDDAAVNDQGQVVFDTAYVVEGVEEDDYDEVYAALVWSDGRIVRLTLGGRDSVADAINQRGQIVGNADTKIGDNSAFLWQKGKMRNLGGGLLPRAINERGQVVGSIPGGHAVLWENGRMRDLGTLGGSSSEALAINERGQIVGTSVTKTGASHAVLWTYKP